MLPNDLIDLQPALRRIVADDEDALQDANLRLLQQLGSIRHPARYAARTARRCRIDGSKANAQRRMVALPANAPLADPAPQPVETLITAEEHERLRRAVESLPPRQRAAIEKPGRAGNSSRYKAKKALRRKLAAGLGPDSA